MSANHMNDALIRAVPDMVSPLVPPRLSAHEPRAVVGDESKKSNPIAEKRFPTETATQRPFSWMMMKVAQFASMTGNDPSVILVDYEEKDPANSLNWSPKRKWLMVLAISLDGRGLTMNNISVFATMTVTPTAPQVMRHFNSQSSFDQTFPFFIAPRSERFGRLPVFHIGNLPALICLVACASSINMPILIAFRFLTGCCLSILTLSPAIVGDLFEMEFTGLSMALVMGLQIIADFVSAVAGAYAGEALGWRWSVWLVAIVHGFFSSLLLAVLRETYALVILRRKAARLQAERGGAEDGNKTYRSKHQARVDATTILENATRPIRILVMSPILMLTQGYMAIAYALVSLVIATITPSLDFAVGNTIALVLYSFTSDRYVRHEREKHGGDVDAFKPEARLVHMLLAAVGHPVAFLIYGWTLSYRAHYMAPLVGATLAGFSMTLSTIPVETYVVDVYQIHGASAIATGVVLRAFAGAFLPLIGPALYESVGQGWGNTVLALIGAAFITAAGGADTKRFGSSGR
ncbi:major facilitator superfamily domain-containing protein [Apodospora peruviana]|uniref:Major facilitator superfamily domain-containing protein n=1 Tax=Apodospora peruviana TaxID=516989 RepID=A0AAE0I068_9PEZI|nr:major facilitator superfamily domain-containing protein [Apodospora peruviana]